MQVMLKVEDAAKKMSDTVTKETKKIESVVESVKKQFGELKNKIAEAFAAYEVMRFGRELVTMTAEFEGFQNRIKFASVDMVDAAQNLAFVREEAEKLHLPMRQIYEGFSEMEAGLRGTGIEGDRLRSLFEGISTAAATLHLPTYQLQRTLYDLKEIGEIGINARIMRSLSTALPGIGPLIQKTFGKGWKELEKEGISGSDFLQKLGPALQKNFEGGLGQYGESLQAKMVDAQNKFVQAQLQVGEKLKPVFIGLMETISGVLNRVSDFVNILEGHKEQLKIVVQIVEGLAAAFIVYKGAMIAATVAEKAWALIKQVSIFLTKEATEANIAFTESLGATALGVFAVGLGLIITAIANYNAELDEAAEKLVGLKVLAGDINVTESGFAATRANMAGIITMTDEQRGRVYEDITKKRKDAQDMLDMKMVGMLGNAEFNVHEAKTGLAVDKNGNLLSAAAQDQKDIDNGKFRTAQKAIEKLNSLKSEYNRTHDIISNYGADLSRIEALGYTKPKYSTMGDAAGEGALHTTHLAGAEGGLGHAKTINIKIDRVMTVENHDNKNLVKHAETAADFIIRTANNYAESQAGTQ